MGDLQDKDSGGLVVQRRRFLSWAVGAIVSFIGAALAIPVVGYVISPALRREDQGWLDAGPLSDLKVGEPTKVEYTVDRADGWIQTTSQHSAWVIRQQDGSLIAFDPRCTHLGCPYSWDTATQRFLCPCHEGVFAIDGKVISGPPPRPLDRFQARVQNGSVFVQEVAPHGG